jgi:tetratricopeptide (TPR) repeat protein
MNRDFPAAVEEFQKAIQINPGMTSVESWYGQALLETGDADGAAEAFRKELASNPNDFESNEKLGSILSARRKFDEALPYLQRAVLVRPGSLEARAALARLETRAVSPPSPTSPVSADSDLLPMGSVAPGFELPRFGASGRASLAEMLRDKPAIVMFGSYTCPQFRSAAAALNALYERYRERTQFVLIYVHEAHTGENWQSTVNQRQGVDVAAEKTLDEKGQHAALCVRKLDLKFPVVVDGMDRKVESAYGAWPSAVYLVGRDGRVLWRSRLGEQNFAPDEMGAAIARALNGGAQKPR